MTLQKFIIEDISYYYDAMTDFLHIIMGESLHLGYWPDPDADMTLPEAQEHFWLCGERSACQKVTG
jgi:hypothetical protein